MRHGELGSVCRSVRYHALLDHRNFVMLYSCPTTWSSQQVWLKGVQPHHFPLSSIFRGWMGVLEDQPVSNCLSATVRAYKGASYSPSCAWFTQYPTSEQLHYAGGTLMAGPRFAVSVSVSARVLACTPSGNLQSRMRLVKTTRIGGRTIQWDADT